MRLHAIVSMPNPRFVIVHYHIFKNGGSTIESILEREFARSFATLHGPDSSSTLDGRHLASFLRQHPHVEAVSSHHLRYPKPSIRHMVIFDCCFLRHPLERLDSLYRYLRSLYSDDSFCRSAREQGPRDFFSTFRAGIAAHRERHSGDAARLFGSFHAARASSRSRSRLGSVSRNGRSGAGRNVR